MKQAALIALMLGTLGFLSLAVAAPPDRSDDKGKRRGPPPEAIEACEELEVDDACTVTLRGEEKTGQCMSGPDGQGPLACRPDDAPDRQGPPDRK